MVRVGLINLKTPGQGMQERNIVDKIKHPKYDSAMKYHDIALLKLDQPLDLGPLVRPVCLDVNENPMEKTAIASGFGKITYGYYCI